MIKKLIYISIFFILFSCDSFAYEQFGGVQENIYGYEFKTGDSEHFLKKANQYLILWEKTKDTKLKQKYLQESMRYYYLLSKADKTRIEAHIGLGKVYDEMKQDKFAKEHFCFAYNINNKNADLNYKFGDFYYKRKDLHKAEFYFNRAEKFGYESVSNLNLKMSKLYDMLADGEKMKKYYYKTISNIDANIERAKKIRLLDEFNSGDSQYYLFIK